MHKDSARLLAAVVVALSMLGVVQANGAPADPVIAAGGDIACNSSTPTPTGCHQMATSDILVQGGIEAVLPLGDLQYDNGSESDFRAYYDPAWGRVKAITHPAPGNHEYGTPGGAGYYAYFGAAAGDPTKGYYSYDIGAWHIVALNSNCSSVPCTAGSPQEQWLRADLAAHPARCTLAYWHHPRFSSGTSHGSDTGFIPFWNALHDYGADIVLNGHEHNYERFAPQDANGNADPHGIRQFVSGTGGRSHYNFGAPIVNSEVRDPATWGVLKLTLHADSYDWNFVPEAGGTFTDSGTGTCVEPAPRVTIESPGAGGVSVAGASAPLPSTAGAPSAVVGGPVTIATRWSCPASSTAAIVDVAVRDANGALAAQDHLDAGTSGTHSTSWTPGEAGVYDIAASVRCAHGDNDDGTGTDARRLVAVPE